MTLTKSLTTLLTIIRVLKPLSLLSLSFLRNSRPAPCRASLTPLRSTLRTTMLITLMTVSRSPNLTLLDLRLLTTTMVRTRLPNTSAMATMPREVFMSLLFKLLLFLLLILLLHHPPLSLIIWLFLSITIAILLPLIILKLREKRLRKDVAMKSMTMMMMMMLNLLTITWLTSRRAQLLLLRMKTIFAMRSEMPEIPLVLRKLTIQIMLPALPLLLMPLR
mmetsp:Transcript_118040/g.165956  ORF Transcript_118040/g.165956 Transcript_118040/m.165956 type:complete len:220 (-) Transcript_118040:642-1301(-)